MQRKAAVRPGRAMRAVALSAAAIGWASPAFASERIYKSVSADGDVTYSQAPLPGSKETTPIEVQTLSPEQRRAALLLRARMERTDRELEELDDTWRLADRQIRDAGNALMQAEEALEAGRALRAGDTMGRVGGGTRLTEAYMKRIASLENRITAAKKRLDQAYDARKALT